MAEKPRSDAYARVRAYLDARVGARGVDIEHITAHNNRELLSRDLEALLAEIDSRTDGAL